MFRFGIVIGVGASAVSRLVAEEGGRDAERKFAMCDLVSRIVRGGFPRNLRARQGLLFLLVGTLAATALTGSLPSAAHAITTSPVASQYEWREVFSKNGSITPVRVPAEPARGVLVCPPSAVVDPPPAVVEPVQVTGPSSDRVDLVYVGDGYTSTDLASYSAQVQAQWQAITSIEPLLTYRAYFNVWQVNVVSAESGVDNDPFGVARDTALDMSFWCNGLDRLLCVDTNKALAYAANAPEAEMVIALANSTTFGGAGYYGTLATLSGDNPAAAQIAVHELGHAFGGLADEYATTTTEAKPTRTPAASPRSRTSPSPRRRRFSPSS